MKRQLRSLLLAAMMLGFAGSGPPVRAQDDADAEEEQPAQPRQRDMFRSDEQFEQWFDQMVFRRAGGLEQARQQVERRLDARIRKLEQMCGLTPAQKKKLGIAGRRDIQRLFDSIEEYRDKMNRAREERDRFIALLRELQTQQVQIVRMHDGDPLDNSTLLGKTLRTMLEKNAPVGEEAKALYRSRVVWVAPQFDEWLGLSRQQHLRFVTLIVEETPPLKFYGEYTTYAVMFQLSRLPEEKLTRILDPGQMRLLHDRFLEARTYEKVLVAKGYLASASTDESQPGVEKDRDRAKPKPRPIRITRPVPHR
jgi:hypothetical protein